MSFVSVIFGGTRGIGRAIARKYLKANLNVVVISRNQENINETLETLRSDMNYNQLKIDGLQCDVRCEESIKNSHDYIEKNVGPTKFLVNAIGININHLLLQVSEEEARQIIETNLLSSINICKIFMKSMMRRKSGSITNIGSIVGLKGNIGQTIYSASKSGLVGFTKSLAKEVASRNITVNLIAPGFIETEMTTGLDLDKIKTFIPLKRTGTPEEVAEAVYFLSTASFITGEILVIDGGLQLA